MNESRCYKLQPTKKQVGIKDSTSLFLVFKVSIEGLKGLVAYINTDELKAEYGNLYVIPKKLDQDIVESFFLPSDKCVEGHVT